MPIVVTGGHRRGPSVTTPIEPGTPGVVERKSGVGYVRYEDTYVAGDDLQQTLNRVTGNQVLTFPEGEFTIPANFVNGFSEGIRIAHRDWAGGCRGISGSGRNTIFKMLASNRDPSGLAAFEANNYFLMAAIPRSADPRVAVEWSQFSIRSNLPHDHNGLRMQYNVGSLVEKVYIEGVQGSNKVPPGETGSVSIHQSSDLELVEVEVDGRLGGAGGPRVSSAPIMVNHSQRVDLTGCYTHHARHGGGGIAWFHATDSVVTDHRSEYIGSGPGNFQGYCFNHEQSTGITYIRPRMIADRANASTNLHMSLNADGDRGGTDCTITVIDPTWDATTLGGGRLTIETWTLPNQQQRRVPDVYAADGVTRIPFWYINPYLTPTAGVR